MTAIREALPEDLAALARLWEAGWHEAHDGRVPEGLVALRTAASFRDRIAGFGAALRVAGPPGAPSGFCVARHGEIDQLYVAPGARGTGTAAALLADGEARLAAQGTREARLACAAGNDRALRFYGRHGWHGRRAPFTAEGGIAIDAMLLEKPLTPPEERPQMRQDLATLPERELFPGFHGRFVHSGTMTFAWWRIDDGAAVPEHSHPHEQVVNVLEGELSLTVGGEEHVLHAGDVVAIPGGVRHAARALGPSRVLDVFSPVREDYR